MRYLPLAIVVAVCVAAMAWWAAANAAPCFTEEMARLQTEAQKPGTKFRTMDGDDARAFMAAYNADPPATDIKADHLLFASNPRVAPTLVIFFIKGCAVGGDQIPPAVMSKLFKAMSGGGTI